jgi:hypothetical protein
MTEMTPEAQVALRRPFPPESIGKLPKGGQMLDYCGHAAVTDRLLTIDPHWSWEPFAIGPDGLPALDAGRNLWIRLTICGVTRIGVGDGKSAKECIGDAIRNAAMRFGVALDLWAKEDLVEFAQAAQRPVQSETFHDAALAIRPPPPARPAPLANPVAPERPEREEGLMLDTTSPLARRMFAAMGEAGISDKDARLAMCSQVAGREIGSSKELTEVEAKAVIEHVRALTKAATS